MTFFRELLLILVALATVLMFAAGVGAPIAWGVHYAFTGGFMYGTEGVFRLLAFTLSMAGLILALCVCGALLDIPNRAEESQVNARAGTDAQRDEARRLIAEGEMTLRAIARQTGLTIGVIGEMRRRGGFPPRKAGRPRADAWKSSRLVGLIKAEVPLVKAAAHVGMPYNTADKVWKRHPDRPAVLAERKAAREKERSRLRDLARPLINTGLNLAQIAVKIGTDERTASEICKSIPGYRKSNMIPEKTRKKAVRLLREGWPALRVAAEVGCSQSAVINEWKRCRHEPWWKPLPLGNPRWSGP